MAVDSDSGVVGKLHTEALGSSPNVLPLTLDLLDPSSRRGWAQKERNGLIERGPADFVLALAVVHHLAITGNVPLPNIFQWLADIARAGTVEFVPKEDPALQTLIRWRKDIYHNYNRENFESSLDRYFNVTERHQLPESGRVLYSFIRRDT